MKPDRPHDALFRIVFGRPYHAASFFRAHLPEAVVSRLDLDAAQECAEHLVDRKLAHFESDVLYKVPFADAEAMIYTLVEHQSTPVFDMPLKLMLYLAMIWSRWRQRHLNARKIPPIVAVVLYHGDRPWTSPAHIRDMLDAPEPVLDALDSVLADCPYLLIDLSKVDDAILAQKSLTALAHLALLAFKHGRRPDLPQRLRMWREHLAAVLDDPNSGLDELVAVLKYLSMVNPQVIREDFVEATRDLGQETESIVMTLAQQWYEEGRVEGEAKGRVEGEAKGRAELLLKQLRLRFGSFPAPVVDRVRTASIDDLDRWGERILEAASLDELFE